MSRNWWSARCPMHSLTLAMRDAASVAVSTFPTGSDFGATGFEPVPAGLSPLICVAPRAPPVVQRDPTVDGAGGTRAPGAGSFAVGGCTGRAKPETTGDGAAGSAAAGRRGRAKPATGRDSAGGSGAGACRGRAKPATGRDSAGGSGAGACRGRAKPATGRDGAGEGTGSGGLPTSPDRVRGVTDLGNSNSCRPAAGGRDGLTPLGLRTPGILAGPPPPPRLPAMIAESP